MTIFYKFSVIMLVVFLLITASCVPNRRIVYLQNENDPRTGEVNNTEADEIIRAYTTHRQEYTLKPQDIISLRIASITPQEFDFVKQYEEQLGLIRKLNQYNQGNPAGASGTGQMRGGTGEGEGGISSLQLDRMQSGFTLDSKGKLELPYIGELQLSGLTISEAEELVKEKLVGFFETPVVRIQLLNFHFTILGEVNAEGRYTTYDPNANIIDALAMAGNLTDFADRSKVKVVRFQGDQAEVVYINTLKENLLAAPTFYLHPNDLIIVPPLQARATKKYTWPVYSGALGIITSTVSIILLLIGLNN